VAEAQVNYEDDFTIEDEDSSPIAKLEARDKKGIATLSPENLYKAGAYSGLMLPSAGIADYFGQYPNPEKAGSFLPSFDENVNKGEYFNAAMQFLGAAGDATYTIPGIGAFTGTALKSLALGGKLSKVQLSKIMDGIGAYMTKTDDPMLAMAGGPNLNIGSSITKMEGPPSGGSKVPEKTKLKKDPKEPGSYLLNYNNKEYKISQFLDEEDVHRGEWSIFERSPATEFSDEGWEWMDTVYSRRYAVDRIKEFDAAKTPVKIDNLNLGSGSLFNSDTKPGRKLLIVSCSKSKCPAPGNMEAFDRYTGDMYKTMKKAGVPKENVDLAIMSAKYGLIRRDTQIPNYDTKMTTEIAKNILQDSNQVNRIRNTIKGYDEVVVEGGKHYKSVIKGAAGDAPNLTDFKIDYEKNLSTGERSNYGSGRQKQSVGNFLRSNTPQEVFHYTQADVPPNIFDLNKASPYDPISNLGIHVGTTSKAAADRFVALNTSSPVRSLYKKGMSLEEALVKGKDYPQAGPPMNPLLKSMVGKETKSSYGSTMPLKANVNKPFLDPKTNEPFTETELFRYLEDKAAKTGTNNTEAAISLRKELANEGYTHIPYVNDFEDKSNLSLIMLIDRPEGSASVLKGKFGKNDPTQRTNPDIMMEDGGVISLKDRAVNMNRGPRGIEPYVQYMEPGGVVNEVILSEPDPQGPPPELRADELERKKERAEDVLRSFEVGDRFSPQTPFSKYSSPDDLNFNPNKQVNPELYNQYQGYKSGVEFGDTETGMDLLNATKFDPLLQAGLRDMRSLSDYAQVIKRERRGPFDRARNITGAYSASDDNLLVLSNAVSGQTLAHELMHKGAQYLANNSKALESLRQGGEAEHRYIQSITNMSFMDRKLNEQSAYLNKLFSEPNASDLLKENIKNGVIRQNNSTLMTEVGRVMAYYYSDANRLTFYSELEKRLGITPAMLNEMINSPRDTNIDQETTKQIFTLANEVMANDFAASRFGKNFKRAFDKSDRQEGFFDMRQFEQPQEQPTAQPTGQEPPRSMAEGGVVGLKDKAVNMHRNMVR
jgi:hypothetical protein